MKKIYNFGAGPSMLPTKILQQIQKELFNWNGTGMSVMEISHRSKKFFLIVENSENDLRDLLNIPDNYKILFCQGGARAQFSAVPMNLLKSKIVADYANSGYWSTCAANEAKKYCKPNILDVLQEEDGIYAIKPMCNWSLSSESAYLHYCPNETIDGIAINEIPDFDDNVIVVGDFSSTLLSQPLNINKFGVIYASAQKNIGIAGLTIVIVREDLCNCTYIKLPSILNYKLLSDNRSLYNTPPIFAWYVAGLIFKWLKKIGGLTIVHKLNKIKASLLYNIINKNNFYYNKISPINRSCMNIPFNIVNSKLEELFLTESLKIGLHALKGHKSVGGLRASLYNAMTLEGVKKLIKFMNYFSKRYG